MLNMRFGFSFLFVTRCFCQCYCRPEFTRRKLSRGVDWSMVRQVLRIHISVDNLRAFFRGMQGASAGNHGLGILSALVERVDSQHTVLVCCLRHIALRKWIELISDRQNHLAWDSADPTTEEDRNSCCFSLFVVILVRSFP